MTPEEFDPVKATRIAKRISLIEPDAAKQLFAAVELFAQQEMERADMASHGLEVVR